MKRISTEAYQALREALAVIVWNKRPFESYLRTALRDNPELLAGLPFAEPKRVVADILVDRLVQKEQKYQQVALMLMLEVASMESFPNIQQIKDEEDRKLRLAEAKGAVERLRNLTRSYANLLTERERIEADEEARRAQSEAQRKFTDEIDALRQRFLELQDESDHQARGKAFERLLTNFFALFDMEPRLAYDLEREQIDGSLSFDTDDYVVEARWRKEPVDRGEADIFAAKVRRKGKNAVGLFVSVNGFTSAALEQYREATPFTVMDGTDLYLALDQRVRLDDLLKSKKRHANETGDCYLPASALASS
jgi:predicted secreted protein